MGETWHEGEIPACLVGTAEDDAAMHCIPPFDAVLQFEE